MAKDDGKGAKPNQQGIEELRYIQQVYQNQYAVMGNSINITLQDLQELNSVQKTIENMDLTAGKEVINAIGAEFFVSGKITNPNSMIVSVGANYLVEKDIDSAKQFVASLIQKRTDNLNKLTKSRKEVEAALIEISYRLENSR